MLRLSAEPMTAMSNSNAAFEHVPLLRDNIIHPSQSAFRMSRELIEQWDLAAAEEGVLDWRYSHDEREQHRLETLSERLHQDLWVFAFGSLMWDPGFYFDEVRYAKVYGFQREFCLLDTIGRGSPKKPGLMAALRSGGQCEGLAFRIGKDQADRESDVVWMREMICPGYLANFHTLQTPQGSIEAMVFEVDEACDSFCHDLSSDEMAQLIATGCGAGGSARSYLENMVNQLQTLGLHDEPMQVLLDSVMSSRT